MAQDDDAQVDPPSSAASDAAAVDEQRPRIPCPRPGLPRQRSSSSSLQRSNSASPPPPPLPHPGEGAGTCTLASAGGRAPRGALHPAPVAAATHLPLPAGLMPAYGWSSGPIPVFHPYYPPGPSSVDMERSASPPSEPPGPRLLPPLAASLPLQAGRLTAASPALPAPLQCTPSVRRRTSQGAPRRPTAPPRPSAPPRPCPPALCVCPSTRWPSRAAPPPCTRGTLTVAARPLGGAPLTWPWRAALQAEASCTCRRQRLGRRRRRTTTRMHTRRTTTPGESLAWRTLTQVSCG